MAKYKNNIISESTEALKALGDISRCRIVMALVNCELCVCQITELFNLAPSTISKHLYILKKANLVQSRKNGRWIYYKLDTANKSNNKLIGWLKNSLEKDSVIQNDCKILKSILKKDPEELCQKTRKKS
jgi:DNA-binding transcriptional ArsR family regulator